jgi:2-polyprenyl-6-methoxyphenol hydroxylase-like FAD-dependent oxidoreductase
LQPATVRWNRKVEAVTDSRVLRFADGSSFEADLVIGADGAFSKVRPAISAAVPQYAGVTFLEARFEDVDQRHPELAELIGPGGARSGDGDRGIFGQRNSGDRIFVYILQRVAADWIAAAGLQPTDTAAIRTHLLEAFSAWSPQLQRIFTDNDGPFIDRPLFVLPVPHTWTPSPSVTLLGDAAHLMPPVGVGVNLAMLDAHDLALALTSSATIADAITSYEQTMLPRATKLAEEAAPGPEDLLSAV